MNTIEKKENGVVFTPSWVVDFMVDEIIKSKIITGKEKILDAGCGDGIFAVTMAKKFSEISKKPIQKVIEENIYFIDVSKKYIETTKQNLQNLSKDKIKKFNGIEDDFCFHNFNTQFDFIIGNPPYVRIQNLNERRNELQRKFITASSGSVDLYFCFFEQALSLLNEDGNIVFITPNSHFYSSAGKHLRNLLLSHIKKIINFDHFQVFKNVTAYTAISFLQKVNNNKFLYAENFKEGFDTISYKEISTEKLVNGKWKFFSDAYFNKFDLLAKNHASLKEIANIHYGIATLKDDIYIFRPDKIDQNYFFRDNFKIEKDLCIPIIKASTYKGEDQGLYIVFPYKNGKVILSDVFQRKYPEAYKYFLEKRSVLESRDKGRGVCYEEFYAFGRNQGLKTSFGRKIITSTMNIEPRFYVIEDEKTSFYSGYCIKPKGDTNIYELCNALNSDIMKEYINATSKSYRGGYKSYAKSFLKDFVHPQFYRAQVTLF